MLYNISHLKYDLRNSRIVSLPNTHVYNVEFWRTWVCCSANEHNNTARVMARFIELEVQVTCSAFDNRDARSSSRQGTVVPGALCELGMCTVEGNVSSPFNFGALLK